MYTRNYARTTRKYTPPPGYDGNAFPDSDTPSVKYHEAEDDLPRRTSVVPPNVDVGVDADADVTEETDLFAEPLPPEEPTNLPTEIPVQTQTPPQKPPMFFEEGFRSLEHLFRQLRGNFGREELILILVMLLIASDASIELLFIALLLVIR